MTHLRSGVSWNLQVMLYTPIYCGMRVGVICPHRLQIRFAY